MEETIRFSKKQVIHDINRQILKRTDIKVGEVYEEIYTHLEGYSRKLRVISEPTQDAGCNWYVLGTGVDEKFIGDTRKFYLADIGVEPYDSGIWNSSNYLRKEK